MTQVDSNGTKPANELVLRVQTRSQSKNVKQKPKAFKFNPDSHVYMASACCQILHYKHAVLVVLAVETVLLIAGAVMYNVYAPRSWSKRQEKIPLLQMGWWVYVGQAVFGVLFVVSAVLLLMGVRSEKGWMLWPHMALQLLLIAVNVIFTITAVISMALGTDAAETIFHFLLGHEQSEHVQLALGPVWPFCLAVIFDFKAAVGIWFYIITRGCYDYLEDKAFFEKRQPTSTTESTSGSSTTQSDTSSPSPGSGSNGSSGTPGAHQHHDKPVNEHEIIERINDENQVIENKF